MKRLLLIVGSEKRWAIANRVAHLRPILDKYCNVSVYAGYSLPSDVGSYDLVHVHRPTTVGADRRLAGLNNVWGVELVSRRTWERVLRLRILDKASFIVGKSRELASLAESNTACRNCVYIPNGVDSEMFSPPTLFVGWVGNLRYNNAAYKGVNLIISACELFNKQYAGLLQVRFVKDPSDYPSRVLSQSEIAKFYKMLSVYVCASLGEGSSNTVLEALASGLPVVTTRVGNWDHLSERGLVVPVSRTVEGIASGIAMVFKEKIKVRQEMRRFSWEKIAEQYLLLYKKLGM